MAKRPWITASSVALVFAAVGLTSAFAGESDGGSGSSQTTPESQRIAAAKAVVEELNLERLAPPVDLENGSCKRAIDVDQVPYCLDSVAETDAEALQVAARIRGSRSPSPERVAWEAAVMAVADASESLQEAHDLGGDGAILEAQEACAEAHDQLSEASDALSAAGG